MRNEQEIKKYIQANIYSAGADEAGAYLVL